MELKEFFIKLKATKAAGFQWYICYDGSIRASEGKLGHYCPITAVYKLCEKKYLDPGKYEIAGEALGLTSQDIADIVYGADRRVNSKFRQKLQKLLGLEGSEAT